MRRRTLMYVTDPATGRRYPIPAGGSDDGDAPDAGETADMAPPAGDSKPDEGDQADGDADALGDAGKKALDAERQARRDAEKARKKLEEELTELRKQAMTDQERAIEEAREAATNEVLEGVNTKLFAAEVRAAAAGKIADPELIADAEMAKRLLKFDEIPMTSDGDIDSAAIAEAVDKLVKNKPYLKGSAMQPDGSADQGARTSGVKQLTREEVQRMSPDEIMKAENEGRLDNILGRTK